MCCCGCLADIFLVVVLVLFPPLPVWIRRGLCSADSLINILLCILGYFPGLIHSWYIIAKYPPYSRSHGLKVYYIHQNSADLERQTHHHHHHHCHGSQGHCHSNSNSQTPFNSHNATIRGEPLYVVSPSYGSTNESTLREGSSAGNSAAPPAYSPLPHKN